MINMFSIDLYQQRAEEIWGKINDLDGITMKYSLEQFYKEMQNKGERQRVMDILNSGRLSSSTVASIFSPGITNYFIINDVGYGQVCHKCGSSGYVLLILDDNYKCNLDNKVFTPCLESYFTLKVPLNSDWFIRMFPVPINPKTDYWYCPYCNEIHKFKYDRNIGLRFDQDIIKVKINKKIEMPDKDEREKMKQIFGIIGL